MFFSLDVLPARKGDCLLLHFGSKDDPGLVLIDGGPANVYKPQLKRRLAQISAARGLSSDDSLSVDLLMVSHIDDDHIKGVLELTSELADAKESQQLLPLKIRSVWHNSFDDIVGNDPHELISAVSACFGAASISGDGSEEEGLDRAAAMVFASVEQGVRLRDDARKLLLKINPQFNSELVMAKPKSAGIDMGKGMTMTVAGPMKPELAALQKAYDAFLKKNKGTRTKSSLASFTDTAVPNLSSLVVLAEVGKGRTKKRILLTGDARGDKILQGLEMVGLLQKDGALHVDILKIPHHGSDRNIDRILFRRITANHYVFSGNGEHGNPERATLQMLLDENGAAKFTVHLTYSVVAIDIEREKNWTKEQNKERTRKKGSSKVKVRENWSPKKHSLAALFEAHPDFAAKIKIVEQGKPHVINLLDEVR